MKKIVVLVVVLVAVGWLAKIRLSAPRPSVPPVATTPSTPTKPAVEIPRSPAPVAPSTRAEPTPAKPAADAKPANAAPADPAGYPQMSLAEVLGPNNNFHDSVFGVSVTYPEGWSVRTAARWGENNRENTVFFTPPEGSAAVPSMYYQKYPDGPPEASNPEAMLREMAQKKEESRSQGGKNDYKHDPGSFVFREVNGYPTLSYFATYTQGDQLRAEYFTRILGENGYVMFFVRGPAKDVQDLIQPVYDMSSTVKPP
jgi:hypothetical protein